MQTTMLCTVSVFSRTIISSPSAYDPKVFPENSLMRRNLVLEKMEEQGYISEQQLSEGLKQALPAPSKAPPAISAATIEREVLLKAFMAILPIEFRC